MATACHDAAGNNIGDTTMKTLICLLSLLIVLAGDASRAVAGDIPLPPNTDPLTMTYSDALRLRVWLRQEMQYLIAATNDTRMALLRAAGNTPGPQPRKGDYEILQRAFPELMKDAEDAFELASTSKSDSYSSLIGRMQSTSDNGFDPGPWLEAMKNGPKIVAGFEIIPVDKAVKDLEYRFVLLGWDEATARAAAEQVIKTAIEEGVKHGNTFDKLVGGVVQWFNEYVHTQDWIDHHKDVPNIEWPSGGPSKPQVQHPVPPAPPGDSGGRGIGPNPGGTVIIGLPGPNCYYGRDPVTHEIGLICPQGPLP
jgi:hypothetical protein